MSTWAIVLAGGSGERFGSPKQVAVVGGRRVLEYSVITLGRFVDGLVIVTTHPGELSYDGVDATIVEVKASGHTRSDSVRQGLEELPDTADLVLVHDGARPLVTEGVCERVLNELRSGSTAVVPVVSVTDTIRHVDGLPVDRRKLRAVQTPQGFSVSVLKQAHNGSPIASDDATLVEEAGVSVALVDGDPVNIKVTYPADLAIVEALYER